MKDLIQYTDKLTYPQKVALEGEIAFAITTSNHDDDIVYRMYTILTQAPKEYYDYILSCFRELCDLPNDTFIRVRNEILYGGVPIWIWMNKCIGDLKESIKLAQSSQSNTISASTKNLKKKIIESAFILFCKKTAMIHANSVIDLCKRVLTEEKLEFLDSACMYLINEINYIKGNKKPSKKTLTKVMETSFDIRDILSFDVEYKTDRNKEKVVMVDDSIEDLMNSDEIISKLLEGSIKTKNKAPYIVKKYFNGSNEGTTLKVFKTRTEAENFIKEIIEQFPDLLNTCTFVIEHQL